MIVVDAWSWLMMLRDTVRVYPCGSVPEIAYEVPVRIDAGVALECLNASSPPGVSGMRLVLSGVAVIPES